MNHIELKLGRDMQTVLLESQETANEKLLEAIELVLKEIVYPMIDKNIE